MRFFFGKFFVFFSFALIFCAASVSVFLILNEISQENESAGMLVSESGLYRKFGDGCALFSTLSLSPQRRRALLMLAHEPSNETEYARLKARINELEKVLPQGNLLFLADESGYVFYQREIRKTRKIFELADEIRILFARLKSVPVYYFPSDAVRQMKNLPLREGNATFPVPANGEFES